MSFLEFITNHENQIIVFLGILVVNLSGVIVYQWKHTTKKTVPKWAWDDLVEKVDILTKNQQASYKTIIEILRQK